MAFDYQFCGFKTFIFILPLKKGADLRCFNTCLCISVVVLSAKKAKRNTVNLRSLSAPKLFR